VEIIEYFKFLYIGEQQQENVGEFWALQQLIKLVWFWLRFA
jgi:hypothetical protein